MDDRDEEKIWTTESDNNGNQTNLSRVPTATANNDKRKRINDDINPYMVGVQSRFRRKYFHKTIFIVMIAVIIALLIAVICIASIYEYVERRCETKDCLRAATTLLSSMDKTVDPCDDFYAFTCGNWAEDHPRPDSSSSFDWFTEKQNKVHRTIRHFLQMNVSNENPEAVKQAKYMYQACMNIDAMDKLGIQPVFDYLQLLHLPLIPEILNITEGKPKNYTFDLVDSLATIKRYFATDILIGFDIYPDPTNRSLNRLVFATPEAGSPLPFKNEMDKRVERIKRKYLIGSDIEDSEEPEPFSAYLSYMADVITALVKVHDPTVDIEKLESISAAKTILKISKVVYKFLDDIENMTSKMVENPMEELIFLSVTELQNVTDRIIAPKTLPIWEKYLKTIFADIPEAQLNLTSDPILTSKHDLTYLENIVEFISNTSLIEMELYIWWSVVEEMIVHTTTDMRKLHNEYARQLTNLESSTPRSIYCTSGVNQLIGMAVSYAIADPLFLNQTKPMVVTMLNNIREAFNNLVRETTWMDDQTKCSTLEKSIAMKSLIGFPEWILDREQLDDFYKDLKLNNTTHLENMMLVIKWKMDDILKSLKEVEEFGWGTTPTNVNAFHTFQANTITVPIAILQYPFYNLGLEALNYGAIGSILGHELTHGFDDSGRMFDRDGNMRQWWSNETIKEYMKRSACFIRQYSDYYLPEVDENINGDKTLGENIADNGGLREAYHAYQLYVKEFGKEAKLVGFEQYTHDQLFFISYGNLWCETQTKTSIKWSLEDSHCPGKIRLKGVLSNSPEFRKTFDCKPNDRMYSKDQCRIW